MMNDERGTMNYERSKLIDRDIQTKKRLEPLCGEANELSAILVSSVRTAKQRSSRLSFLVHHSSL
jgi:hypothetical protein